MKKYRIWDYRFGSDSGPFTLDEIQIYADENDLGEIWTRQQEGWDRVEILADDKIIGEEVPSE